MKLEKYQSHLFKNIKEQLSQWFEEDKIDEINNEEVYRFLHSIKGTAGTLQLGGLMQLSDYLLLANNEMEIVNWRKNELRNFLFDLIELTYAYEHFNGVELKTEVDRETAAGLIQIIDDDVSMLIFLKDILEENGWMVITNTDPEKATQQYFDMQPDCLILDVQLPSKTGFQILDDIQQHNEKYFIPKIMISIQNDKESRLKAYKMGADDFIGKPIDVEEFLAKMDRHLQRKRLFDQSVLIDELTQVYNRRFFEDSITRFFQDFKRTKQGFTIAVLDLDRFKCINDTHGHLMGDQVLMEFAKFLKQSIRSSDIVFRYGGEEFVVIFPRASNEDVERLLNQMIQNFSTLLFTSKDQTFSVTFSAGVYTVEEEAVTPESAFKKADSSLYLAKRSGRARAMGAKSSNMLFKKKVLNISIVDDDVIIRTMLTNILESMELDHLDMKVAAYENGGLFLASNQAKENHPHFLILDGIMPDMDGLEVLKTVKQAKNAACFTVLMLTGRKSEEDIARALQLGADDYVTKPFSVQELQRRIERLVKQVK